MIEFALAFAAGAVATPIGRWWLKRRKRKKTLKAAGKFTTIDWAAIERLNRKHKPPGGDTGPR